MKGSTTPLVSVITPCFNAARYIAETINSVRAQTYAAIEHIVVDDGSTDGSWSIVAAHLDRITAVRVDRNRGAAAARNRGAALARGDFLMFLDADDLLEPDTVATLVAAVRERPGHIAVCAWNRLQQTQKGWRIRSPGIPFPPPEDALDGWLTGIWVPPCAVLWRRDVYEGTGGWNERITVNDDGDLMMRAMARGARLCVAPGTRSLYRIHGSTHLSLSNTSFMKGRLETQVVVLQNLADELARVGRLPQYTQALGTAFYRLSLAAFHNRRPDLGQLCAERGKALGGSSAVSRTLAGRVLTSVLGLELKERILLALARRGFGTRARLGLTAAAARRTEANGIGPMPPTPVPQGAPRGEDDPAAAVRSEVS